MSLKLGRRVCMAVCAMVAFASVAHAQVDGISLSYKQLFGLDTNSNVSAAFLMPA